ncbi:MAG TPA: molybdenum cofactor guanylyltransferase [Ferruginibacter sp.]|nr:molybdenum cofactor guanylyltransferase [Ferruginibacter sp.]
MNGTVTEKKYILPNTYGLVVCGGNSSRMGTDKSMLQYYDKPQRYHVYDMLQPFCEKVFISCNEAQVNTIEPGYDFIQDDIPFSNIGPLGALLTAFAKYPGKHMLLIGCDYPFLKAAELEIFSKLCIDIPASFYNREGIIYESMLAWYPFTCFDLLKRMFDAKQFSLQHLLRKTDATKYLPTDTNCIKSVDTIEAFNQTIKLINAG